MTVSEIIKLGSQKLKAAKKDDADFDSQCLAAFVTGCNISTLRLKYSDSVTDSEETEFFGFIDRRINGEPLQYIIKEWDFMGRTFDVGEGVLIPRPETEQLVEYALDFLKDKSEPTVIDLCSGSGCIAVSIAAERPDAKVYAVEKFPGAFGYLLSNIGKIGVKNVNAVNGDIFDSTVLSDIEPDLILSNPPYIRTSDLSGLQEEVKKEPVTALDGGSDGYDFYRVLASHWMKKLPKGGMIAVECGEDQTEYISELFKENADSAESLNDLSGLPRIVGAII